MTMAAAPTLQIHSVLYGNTLDHLRGALRATARAAELAQQRGLLGRTRLAWGDCSPGPIFGETSVPVGDGEVLERIDYTFFDANLGSAGGHNRLLEAIDSDLVLILNPDTHLAPNALVELLERVSADASIGIAEARQIPFEHPRDYDPVTGDTGWASTACALVPAPVFGAVGGFDSDTFFLYCDDVDWSWRVRHAAYRVVMVDTATVFHDKRLTRAGRWIVSRAEEFYSAEAAMLLAYKWGRPDLYRRIRSDLSIGTPVQQEAVAAVAAREAQGRMPSVVKDARRTACFVRGGYAPHRF